MITQEFLETISAATPLKVIQSAVDEAIREKDESGKEQLVWACMAADAPEALDVVLDSVNIARKSERQSRQPENLVFDRVNLFAEAVRQGFDRVIRHFVVTGVGAVECAAGTSAFFALANRKSYGRKAEFGLGLHTEKEDPEFQRWVVSGSGGLATGLLGVLYDAACRNGEVLNINELVRAAAMARNVPFLTALETLKLYPTTDTQTIDRVWNPLINTSATYDGKEPADGRETAIALHSLLVAAGAENNGLPETSKFAALFGSTKNQWIWDQLLEWGAPLIEPRNGKGGALAWTIGSNNEHAMDWLLEHGHPKAGFEVGTAFTVAVYAERYDALISLVKRGFEPGDEDIVSATVKALCEIDADPGALPDGLEALRTMFEKGFPVDGKPVNNPVSTAISGCDQSRLGAAHVLALLYESGADFSVRMDRFSTHTPVALRELSAMEAIARIVERSQGAKSRYRESGPSPIAEILADIMRQENAKTVTGSVQSRTRAPRRTL